MLNDEESQRWKDSNQSYSHLLSIGLEDGAIERAPPSTDTGQKGIADGFKVKRDFPVQNVEKERFSRCKCQEETSRSSRNMNMHEQIIGIIRAGKCSHCEERSSRAKHRDRKCSKTRSLMCRYCGKNTNPRLR